MDMSVNIAGVEWKNPVTVASGTFGSGAEFADYVDINKLGAVTTKGVANVPWVGNPTPRVNILGTNNAIWGIIAVSLWIGCAFNTLIYIAGLQSIDTDVYEAADLDGATGFKRFSKITFPLLAPSFTINMVLSAKGYLMVYDQIMAMTDGGPGTATTSIAVLIYKKGFGGGQFAYQSANAVVLFIVVVLISVFQLRILEKREEKLG